MFQNLQCLDTLFVHNVDACGAIYTVTGGGMLAFQNKMIHIQVYGGEKIIITSITPHMACMYFYGWFLINEVNRKLLIYLQ